MAHDGAVILCEEADRFGLRYLLGRGGVTLKPPGFATGTPFWMQPETLDAIVGDVERLARRYHDPDPFSFRRVVMAPRTPTYGVRSGELRQLARPARPLGPPPPSHLSANPDYTTHPPAPFS